MPLQNRVNPWGDLFRTEARGGMMGNRGGAIHNEQREIVRPFKSKRWITCVLEFRGRKRTVMTPRRYTELFFWDEATAFAAGHRPCAECRRERFNAFVAAWSARKGVPARKWGADDIDEELHAARMDREHGKVSFEVELREMPNGCFVEIEGDAFLVWNGELLLWSPAGYRRSGRKADAGMVRVLTPKPIVECFRAGYVADVRLPE
jgi:hypothetical protein